VNFCLSRASVQAVIPAKAGLSTAELVIHLLRLIKIKMDSRFRGNDVQMNSGTL